jgi:hypothetical protein
MRKRFEDVSSWATYVILTQLLPDERRAAFGCLLRVAITCWNIGNFIGAKEIITGLRWVKLMIRKNEIYYVTHDPPGAQTFHSHLPPCSLAYSLPQATLDQTEDDEDKFSDEKSFREIMHVDVDSCKLCTPSAGVSFSLQW